MTKTQQGRSTVGKAIMEFHYEIRYWDKDELNDTKLDAFRKVQPDRVAFNEKAKICSFLEFARPMDSRDGSSEQPDCYTGANWTLDWAQEKDLAKNARYACHLGLSFGYHGERGENGLQLNTTSW